MTTGNRPITSFENARNRAIIRLEIVTLIVNILVNYITKKLQKLRSTRQTRNLW